MKRDSTFAAIPWRKQLANLLFPHYSRLLDQVNNNALVTQWIKQHASIPVLSDRVELYRFLDHEHLKGEAINYLEFGVHKGASIQAWAMINDNPMSRFVGFDSFHGLPQDFTSVIKRGSFDVSGETPRIDDSRVSFVKGWFQKTLSEFLEDFRNDKRLVVHNDSDLYSSTAYCLAKLDVFLSPGTIIIFDEFCSPLHEFRAWNDYLRAFARQAKSIAMTPYAQQAAFLFE